MKHLFKAVGNKHESFVRGTGTTILLLEPRIKDTSGLSVFIPDSCYMNLWITFFPFLQGWPSTRSQGKESSLWLNKYLLGW